MISFPRYCDTDVLKWMIWCSKKSPASIKPYQISLPPFCYILCSISNLFWHSRKLDKSNPDHVSSNQNLISLNLFNLQVYAMHGLSSEEMYLKAKRRLDTFPAAPPTLTMQILDFCTASASANHDISIFSRKQWAFCKLQCTNILILLTPTISYFSACVKDSHRECVIERQLFNENDKKKCQRLTH